MNEPALSHAVIETVTEQGTASPNAPSTISAKTNTSSTDENANECAHALIAGASPAEQVAYAHATLFSPSLSTLTKALNKGFITNFPGLTSESLSAHPPQSVAMIKGHLDQSRKNQRSTKPKTPIKSPPSPTTDDTPDELFPNGLTTCDDAHHHCCYVDMFEPTGKVYTAQTGKFITQSSRGNNYIMVLYDYDSNCILTEAFADRNSSTIVATYKTLYDQLAARGLRPKLQILDNECSNELKA
jgi:hypothetical protein